MRKFILLFTLTAFSLLMIIILSSSDNLFGQKPDSLISSQIKSTYQFSLSLVTSPLLNSNLSVVNDGYLAEQPNAYMTIPTGLIFNLRFGKEIGTGLSVGFLFDFKKYYYNFYSPSINPPYSNSTYIVFNYHFLYYPVLINYYIKNYYISFGAMFRSPFLPIGISAYDAYTYNPTIGFQIGFGEIFNINRNLSIQIEPYVIFTGAYDPDVGKVASVNETISSGPLIGIYLKLNHKIIKF